MERLSLEALTADEREDYLSAVKRKNDALTLISATLTTSAPVVLGLFMSALDDEKVRGDLPLQRLMLFLALFFIVVAFVAGIVQVAVIAWYYQKKQSRYLAYDHMFKVGSEQQGHVFEYIGPRPMPERSAALRLTTLPTYIQALAYLCGVIAFVIFAWANIYLPL